MNNKNCKFCYCENCINRCMCTLCSSIVCTETQNSENINTQSKVSLLQKAQNFTKSIINHVSNGMIKVSESVKQERMAICRTCPFFNSNNTCNKCGCFLDVKTGWASEKCPEGKWLEIKTQSSGGCGCSKKT